MILVRLARGGVHEVVGRRLVRWLTWPVPRHTGTLGRESSNLHRLSNDPSNRFLHRLGLDYKGVGMCLAVSQPQTFQPDAPLHSGRKPVEPGPIHEKPVLQKYRDASFDPEQGREIAETQDPIGIPCQLPQRLFSKKATRQSRLNPDDRYTPAQILRDL
jgi:hypothetical protein